MSVLVKKHLGLVAAGSLLGWCGMSLAQTTASAAEANSSRIGPDGTAYTTRVVPVPRTISAEAQRWLAQPASDKGGPPRTVAEDRAGVDQWQQGAGEVSQRLYPVTVSAATIAGVPVRVVMPPKIAPGHGDCVLMNLHGGGFRVDSGSLTESIPMAALTGTKVVSVLYRIAPEHPFPAAVEDVIAVYRELLKTYRPAHIVIYGTSAGAVLTAEVTAKIKQLGLPMPAATGIFSGTGDMSQPGDSQSLYGLNGLSGYLATPKPGEVGMDEYAGSTNLKDPVLSPLYGDLTGFPPTLFVTSGRDLLLSGTTILHRAYLRAGVDAELVVFEALPHAFWNNPELPEAKEADAMMAKFFDKYLPKQPNAVATRDR